MKKIVVVLGVVIVAAVIYMIAVPSNSVTAPFKAALSGGIKPGVKFRDCAECPEMIVIPPGSFVMGSPENEEGRYYQETPQHTVTIPKAFAVGIYEASFADWDACRENGECKRPISDNGWGRGKQPLMNVTWMEANAFVQWLGRKTGKNYRLLSESEWEYVARAGSSTAYWWGKEAGQGNAVCETCGSQWDNKQTSPVGSFKPNAFGVYDTAGNLREWVQDCIHDNYTGAPADGAPWTDARTCDRMMRGGSWGSYPATVRSAARIQANQDESGIDMGFRIARDLVEGEKLSNAP